MSVGEIYLSNLMAMSCLNLEKVRTVDHVVGDGLLVNDTDFDKWININASYSRRVNQCGFIWSLTLNQLLRLVLVFVDKLYVAAKMSVLH